MKRAFTLIELLVVIAITAILAAILFPVFNQAKEAARKTADPSNMNHLGIATQMYMSDHDDTLLFYASYIAESTVSVSRNGVLPPNKAATYPVKWWNELMLYLHNTGVLVAPTTRIRH
jgi:prepilin-type N-terminal cleavage/methylation domain-containing protein